MNFWEAQHRRRVRTTIYLLIFTALTVCVAAVAEWAMRVFAQDAYQPPFPYVGLIFIGVTFLVAFFQYSMFSTQGGAYVAEAVGAYRVDPKRASPKEQQLLNIVEEVAIAASVPIPPVYILDANEINAFAAGLSPNDATVTVTRGCLNLLNRDELQGVIAHEMGHIQNGDMTISMRVAAMVMGFYFVLYIAMRLLQISSYSSDSRDDNGRRGGNPIMMAAIILVVAGAFMWLAGSILKSMISREREYLADACSVQYTRNPEGIANALRKIAGESVHDMPKSGIAYSHMYLSDTSLFSSLFASHPPIDKRIAAIEGRTYMDQVQDDSSSSQIPKPP